MVGAGVGERTNEMHMVYPERQLSMAPTPLRSRTAGCGRSHLILLEVDIAEVQDGRQDTEDAVLVLATEA